MEWKFPEAFHALTGHEPFPWQSRLYGEHFCRGDVPSRVDVPTGLGKTSVMALWLIARAAGAALPRRLIYVVDRRAIVDQATDEAVQLRQALERPEAQGLRYKLDLSRDGLPVSTLRGQLADNRAWLRAPSSPAIIIATVDMAGSRLLFEGYAASRKMRPFMAGLLGADTLFVLDEAHLVPPFERLMESIDNGAATFGPRTGAPGIVPPLRLLSLSATGRERAGTVFRLDPQEDGAHPVAARRLKAVKTVKIIEEDAGRKLGEALASEAWELLNHAETNIRLVVYAHHLDVIQQTCQLLEKKFKAANKSAGPSGCVVIFTGQRRGHERDQARKQLAELGFLAPAGQVQPLQPGHVVLVATAAAEVGVDLDADHMVCDLVAWERLVQRLGRVNRRGGEGREARCVVIAVPPQDKDEAKPADAMAQYAAQLAAARLLEERSASPAALLALKQAAAADPQLAQIIAAATTPEPLRPDLTRATLEAWSLTSLDEHTGRPAVRPWLRGWVEEKPQMSVVWRTHLPVAVRGSGSKAARDGVDPAQVQTFFSETARIHVSEILEAESWQVVAWLAERAAALLKEPTDDAHGAGQGEPDTIDEDDGTQTQPDEAMAAQPAPVPLKPQDVCVLVLDHNDKLFKQRNGQVSFRLRDLVDEKGKASPGLKALARLDGLTLVLDSRLGGLSEDGFLDADCGSSPAAADTGGGDWAVPFRVEMVLRSALDAGGGEARPPRPCKDFVVERDGNAEPVRWLSVRARSDGAGDTDEDRRSVTKASQTLADHQAETARCARAIAGSLNLPERWSDVLTLAARVHDEGKAAARWQNAFSAPRDGRPYAKTEHAPDQSLLDHYRHETGSLLSAARHPDVRALDEDQRDLLLHIVAAHHGHARPLIGIRNCEGAPPSALQDLAAQAALRFARLQGQWGVWGLAWWEALLRAADWQASEASGQHTDGAHRGSESRSGG